MIRRGFWLAAGAVLGVAGYRRVTRLARGLTGGSLVTQAPVGRMRPPAAAGETASASPALAARPAHPARRQPPGTLARVLAAVGFARDVRAGMAEYLDLHHRELARTLGSRSGPASPG